MLGPMTYGVISSGAPGSAAASPTTLDTVTGALAAYATRKLRTAYSGNCVTLRRSSDNSEMAFGFDADGYLDESAVTTWLAGADGFVKTWHDQSENGNDLTQTTPSAQPQLTLDAHNSVAALDFDGGNHYFPATFSSSASDYTLSAVMSPIPASTTLDHYVLDAQTGRLVLVMSTNFGDKLNYPGFYDGAWSTYGDIRITMRWQTIMWRLTANPGIFINGFDLPLHSTSAAPDAYTQTAIGGSVNVMSAHTGTSGHYAGQLSEYILLPSAVSTANRQVIENDHATVYNLTIDSENQIGVAPEGDEPYGVWTWFGDPRAIRVGTKTYIGYLTSDGSADIVTIPDNGSWGTPFTIKSFFGTDDHNNPVLFFRASDGALMVFYCQHNGNDMFLRINTTPDSDLTNFGAETNLDSALGGGPYTYPNPLQLTDETNDPIYLFYRDRSLSSDGRLTFSKSEDDGVTWAAQTQLYDSDIANNVYFKIASNGTDRIDFLVTDGHPRDAGPSSIYHFYYTGGNYFQSDGTQIVASLPLMPGDLTKIHDGSTEGNSWIWDIAYDGSGNPVIVYTVFESDTDHRYRYGKWNGTAWVTNEIVAGGGYIVHDDVNEPQYSGGIHLNHDNVNEVYLGREVSGVHEIWKYTTADGGSTWGGTAITSGSEYGNARPVVPRNSGGGVSVVWFTGDYYSAVQYNTLLKLSGV